MASRLAWNRLIPSRILFSQPTAPASAAVSTAFRAILTSHTSNSHTCIQQQIRPRSIHIHVRPLLGEINPDSLARTSGPGQVEMVMEKRIHDRLHETEALEEVRTHPPICKKEEFLARVDQIYARLRAGLVDMLLENKTMKFLPSDGHRLEIDLGVDEFTGNSKGSFTFQPELDTQRLILFDPISASVYHYHFDPDTQWWTADSDSHIFDELFVRDILRADLKGFPKL